MFFRSFAGLMLPVALFAMLGVELCGCKKESVSTTTPAGTPAVEPAPAAEPPPPPPYVFPDKLPVHATLKFDKHEDGGSVYKVTFDTKFTFDPARAQLALDINTVGWAHHGRIVITNKGDKTDAGAEAHHQDYDDPPTTETLNLPEEHQLLSPKENQWVKEGGITITIANTEGGDTSAAAAAPPEILTVDLVAP